MVKSMLIKDLKAVAQSAKFSIPAQGQSAEGTLHSQQALWHGAWLNSPILKQDDSSTSTVWQFGHACICHIPTHEQEWLWQHKQHSSGLTKQNMSEWKEPSQPKLEFLVTYLVQFWSLIFMLYWLVLHYSLTDSEGTRLSAPFWVRTCILQRQSCWVMLFTAISPKTHLIYPKAKGTYIHLCMCDFSC